jgi:hypothetical protein
MPAFIDSLEGRSDEAYAKATAAAPASVTVDVLNGTSVARLAARNATQLKQLGFHTNTVDSTPSPATTTAVEYPPGHEAQAKAVVAVVPGAKPVATSDVSRVTVVLGSDGKQVKGLVTATPAKPSGTKAANPSASAAAARLKAETNGLGCIN